MSDPDPDMTVAVAPLGDARYLHRVAFPLAAADLLVRGAVGMRVGLGHADHHRHPGGSARPARAGGVDRLPPGARLAGAARQESDARLKRAGWLLAGGAALLLAGCGQKGALYLPDKNAQVVTIPAAPPTPTQSAPSQPAPEPQSAPASTPPATPAPPKPGDKSDDSETPR